MPSVFFNPGCRPDQPEANPRGWGDLFRTVLLLFSVLALPAAEFPTPINTNTENHGTDAPPWTAEQAVAQMKSVPTGFKASVFAAEPDVQNPVQISWDSRGRLWVVENYTYESDAFTDKFRDRIVILEGADGNGKFTSRKVFTDDLTNTMGVATGYGGAW